MDGERDGGSSAPNADHMGGAEFISEYLMRKRECVFQQFVGGDKTFVGHGDQSQRAGSTVFGVEEL